MSRVVPVRPFEMPAIVITTVSSLRVLTRIQNHPKKSLNHPLIYFLIPRVRTNRYAVINVLLNQKEIKQEVLGEKKWRKKNRKHLTLA